MDKKRSKEADLPLLVKNANEFVNVRDIKKYFLYSKDGYIFGYVRFFPFNLDLLSREERYQKSQALTASFESDRKNFTYVSFPRTVDLDGYKNYLKRRHKEEINDPGKRKILSIMMRVAQELSTSGENYEHQHYIKLWQRLGNRPAEAQHDLYVRLEEFKNRYTPAGIQGEILEEQEIITLCNLFGNSRQVTYETVEPNLLYSGIPQIR